MTGIPRALYGIGYNYLGSDRFVEDASFVRLKMITLKYSLPKPFIQRFGINRFDVFTTIQDVFTWTNYSGQDPEVSLNSGRSEEHTSELQSLMRISYAVF